MRCPTRSFALVLVLVATAPGCVNDAETSEAPSESEEDLTSKILTEADAGKPVTVAEGLTVTVSLPENPTTGYSWKVSQTDRSFGSPFRSRFIASTERGIGTGGERRFYWRTTSTLGSLAGKHSVRFEYSRATGAPAKELSFEIEIVRPGARIENEMGTVEIGSGDAEKVFDVKEGQDIRVRLASSPASGFDWKVTKTSRTLGYPEREWVQGNGAEGTGWTAFVWHTAEASLSKVGDHDVTLELPRKSGAPTTFTFTARVSK
jgi:predicted secreted protein